MAIPKPEETVVAPATTTEAVVAEAASVKAVDVVKEVEAAPAASSTEEAIESSPVKVEEPAAETSDPEPESQDVATPVEPSIPEFKAESNLVSDLKDSEKKALEEFRLRIQKAIQDDEFKVPKPVVKGAKEAEKVEAVKEPEPVVAPVEEKVEEKTTPAGEAPLAETAGTPVTESPVAPEEKAKEVSPAAPVETKAEEKTADPIAEAKPATEVTVEEKAAPVAEKVNVSSSLLEVVKEKASSVVAGVEKVVAVVTEKVEEKKTTADEKASEVPTETVPPVEGAEVKASDAVVVEAVAVEEEPEDTTPAEDISLWGVPLLYTKGDKRTDVVLLKFLRAREFNVKAAFDQLKTTIIWRKTFKADTLLEENFGTELDVAAYMHGQTKEGQPVCYNSFGCFQDKELYQKTFGDDAKVERYLRWRIQVLEKGIRLLNFTPEGPSTMVQITDLKNSPIFGLKDLSAANQTVTLLQDNYPELNSKKVFINTPIYFSAMYNFISPLLSKRTKSKLVVAPAGNTTGSLLKFISADNIPVQYGGLSRTNDTEFTGVSAPVQELVLKGGKSVPIEIPVTEVGSTIVWDLAVLGYEVYYGAEFIPSAEGSYTTVLAKRAKLPSTTEAPVRTSFIIPAAGKVVLTVDNSSRKKKTIIYRYVIKDATVETETS